MRLVWTPNGWEDYLYWQKLDKKKLKRVNALLTEIIRDPKGGIGKPEPLQFGLSGCWSRRIDQEHRLVYLIDGDDVVILQARYHYSE